MRQPPTQRGSQPQCLRARRMENALGEKHGPMPRQVRQESIRRRDGPQQREMVTWKGTVGRMRYERRPETRSKWSRNVESLREHLRDCECQASGQGSAHCSLSKHFISPKPRAEKRRRREPCQLLAEDFRKEKCSLGGRYDVDVLKELEVEAVQVVESEKSIEMAGDVSSAHASRLGLLALAASRRQPSLRPLPLFYGLLRQGE